MLVILFIIQLVFLFYCGARVYQGESLWTLNKPFSLAARMVVSGSLLLTAFFLERYGSGISYLYSKWVLWGMLFSFAGDLMMAKVIPFPNHMAGGMVFFFLTHFFYIKAYQGVLGNQNAPFPDSIFYLALIMVEGTIMAIWYWLAQNIQEKWYIKMGAFLYSLWIGVMVTCSWVLAKAAGGMWWAAFLGAVLFLLSDLMIAIGEMGRRKSRSIGEWVWMTYAAGQMAIIYSPFLQNIFTIR